MKRKNVRFKDEAGLLHHPADESPIVRNLTIGALIIIGGTVAALPFRRASVATGPENNESVLATGPSSDLTTTGDSVPFEQLWVASESNYGVPSRSAAGSPTSLASQVRSADAPQGIPSNAVARPRRDLRVPLSYDDLAVPLNTPHFTDGRFDALATHQDRARQNASPLAQSPTDSIANRTPRSNGIPRGYESMKVAADPSDSVDRRRAPWEMDSDLPQSILADSAGPGTVATTPPPRTAAAFAAAPPSTSMFGPAPTHRDSQNQQMNTNQVNQEQTVQGQLASESKPRASAAHQPVPSTRTRHWIRQPE